MFEFNPFSFIKETNASPHALTLRSSLWEKLKDTFWVLSSDNLFFKREATQKLGFGVLDWLTLGIPKLLLMVSIVAFYKIEEDSSFKWTNVLAGLFLTIFGLPSLLLHGTVVLISLSLMAALSPLIAIVHGFSQIKGAAYKKEALKAVVNPSDRLASEDYKQLFALQPIINENEQLKVEITINKQPVLDSSTKKALMKLNIGNCVRKYEKSNSIYKLDIENGSAELIPYDERSTKAIL